MSVYVRASRVVVAAIIAILALFEVTTTGTDVTQAAEELTLTPSRSAQVSSRGGPRAAPTAMAVMDVLAVRSQFPPPTPTPAPTPTDVPTPTPEPTKGPHGKQLGVFTVTGYSDSPRNGTDGRGITKSGERTRWGVVAVDPRVIPLRSKLVIEGMEDHVFTALDTGGGIHGNWVDVWFPTDWDALQHGIRKRSVFLVEE